MRYNNFICSAIFLLSLSGAKADVPPYKYEATLRAGNYYTINRLFPNQRYSNSVSIGFAQFLAQNNAVEIQLQRGEFQYQIRGIETYSRGVNSTSTDYNIAAQWKHAFMNKNRIQVLSGIGVAFTRHSYKEPGYRVSEHEWSSNDIWIMTDPMTYEKQRMELSMPLSLEWKYSLKPRIHLSASLQHYLQPARIFGFGYGTGLSLGLGYLF